MMPTQNSASTFSHASDQPIQAAPPSEASHEIQLRYKLSKPTFKTLCTIIKSPSRADVLKKACFATEFSSFPIKPAEKTFFREVNEHTAIPHPIKENVSQPWHKVFLLVQLGLLHTSWPNKLSAPARKELHQDRGRILGVLDRVLRCLVDILGERDDGKGVITALDVLRSVKSGVWEGSEKQLLQVDGIGPAKMSRLFDAEVRNIKQLSKMEFYHIERLLSRNPPFGQTMVRELAHFPVLTLQVEILGPYVPPSSVQPASATDIDTVATDKKTWIVRMNLGYENAESPRWKKRVPWVTLVIQGDDGRLAWFWRGSITKLDGDMELIVGLYARKGERLTLVLACEEIVGAAIREGFEI